MEKFCVFCGDKPKEKNNEHIIPRWLIELTGDPNRVVKFGPVWNEKTSSLEIREFAFDQFQFPACESCNSKYALLETRAKNIIQRILAEEALSNEDFSVFLDWMDKIRVGLWLAYNYLQKNISEVEPNYHISKRIGTKDRAVFIYKSDSKETGVTFSGTNVPAFQYFPVCFNLRINQFCFFNLSTDFLLSKHLGLPYSREIYFTEGQEMKHIMSKGRERVAFPIIRAPYNRNCTEVFQPMLMKDGFIRQIDHLNDTAYAKDLFEDYQNGVGRVFMAKDSRVTHFPIEPTDAWIPKTVWDLADLTDLLGKQVLQCQIHFLNRGGKYTEVKLEKRKLIKAQHDTAKRINRFLLEDAD